MKNSTKNTLRCVIALSVISVVCVALLAVANRFLPKYKPSLDLNTVTLINGIVPSGVDDKTALDEGYYEMLVLDDKKLADFNKNNRAEANNAVLAVYRAVKGDNAGAYIVEAQAQGYAGNDPIVMLTAIDEDGAIISVVTKKQTENSPGTNGIFEEKQFALLVEYVKGKTSIDGSGLSASTGATSSYSVGGVANAIGISLKVIPEVKGGSL